MALPVALCTASPAHLASMEFHRLIQMMQQGTVMVPMGREPLVDALMAHLAVLCALSVNSRRGSDKHVARRVGKGSTWQALARWNVRHVLRVAPVRLVVSSARIARQECTLIGEHAAALSVHWVSTSLVTERHRAYGVAHGVTSTGLALLRGIATVTLVSLVLAVSPQIQLQSPSVAWVPRALRHRTNSSHKVGHGRWFLRF
jgi:hypothetical protein